MVLCVSWCYHLSLRFLCEHCRGQRGTLGIKRSVNIAACRVHAFAQRDHMVIRAEPWDRYVCSKEFAESLYLVHCECQFSGSSIFHEPTAGVIFHAARDTSSLIHDCFISASISRGQIAECPHAFILWRWTDTVQPPSGVCCIGSY